jgi:ubiquitin carboxyl-terminal hydrolase 7
MNAMLQSLFHFGAFRRLVYQLPSSGTEDVDTSIPLNLQKLFCRMQLSDKAVSTRGLTVSFGWDASRAFVQHDTQEFCRKLLDNLERKMKHTALEGRIAELFRGRFRSHVRCKNIIFESSGTEEFYDLSLQVRDCGSLQAALEKYVERELLDGANQYDTGTDYGKQDAYVGVEFVEFPPVLQLHLRRFEYDFAFDRNIKVNDRFEFPESIDLGCFVNEHRSNVYDLVGVLVHAGEVAFGHYYAFLRTSMSPQWYQFNDARVTTATEKEAISANFGGNAAFSAYVFVYVRHEDAPGLFEAIPDEAIPQHIRDLANEPDAVTPKSSTDVYDMDASIRRNTLTGVTGMKCPEFRKSLTFETDDTHEVVYLRIASLFELPVEQLRVF